MIEMGAIMCSTHGFAVAAAAAAVAAIERV
jgi:hypothetical protein